MFKDENRHYSLRKLSVGLASVLIGISFVSGNSHTVKADTVKDGSNGAQTVVQTTARGSNTVVKGHDVAVKIDAKDGANTAAKANAESTPKEQSHIPEAVAKRQNNIVKDNSNETTLNAKGSEAIASNMLKEDKTEAKENQDWTDPATNKVTTNKKLNTKMVASSKTILQANDTNGGFDSSWGKLDVNDWKGSVQGNYYQLTDYTGDANHVIVPNEADFTKAGISTSGKQVGVTSDLMHRIFAYKATATDATVAFSKTDNKMVKTIGSDLVATWNSQDNTRGAELSRFDGTNLDVSNVTNMSQMFYISRISDLSSLANWNINNVTDMSYMFAGNQISDLSPLANWNVNKATNMNQMFENNQISNLSPLSNWHTDHVTNIGDMFSGNQISDLSPLSNWHTDHVTDMADMFENNQISNLSPLTNWNTDHVTNMGNMFAGNLINDLSPLAKWNVNNVTNMSYMFAGNQISDLTPLANWDTSKINAMDGMFENCRNLSDISPLANWDTSNVTIMIDMFDNTALKKVTLTNWDFSNIDPSYVSIFPDTNFEATLSDKTSKSLLNMSSKLLDTVKEKLKGIYSAPIVDGVPDVNGDLQYYLDSIKQTKEWYQQQLAYYKQQIDYYKKELVDPNTDAATKENNQSELKQAEQTYQDCLTGDGKKEYDEQIQDLQEQFNHYKQEIQQEINQYKLQAEYPLNSVFGNHSKITTPNRDLLVYLVGKLPVKSDAATRTIEITFPDGTKKTINQSVGYGKYAISGTADMATHKLDMAMPYELSKWELIKKEDGSYDLVKAHVDKNGVASFDNVALPKIPGYKAKVVRNNGLLMVSYLVFAPEKPATNNNLNELQFSNKLATNSTVKSNIVVKSDMYQVVNDDHNWQLPVIKSYDLKFATNKNQIIFAYTKDKQYNYRFVLTFKDGQYRLTTFNKQGKLLKTYSIKSYKKLVKIIHSLVAINIA